MQLYSMLIKCAENDFTFASSVLKCIEIDFKDVRSSWIQLKRVSLCIMFDFFFEYMAAAWQRLIRIAFVVYDFRGGKYVPINKR